jgi:hypothetical protein
MIRHSDPNRKFGKPINKSPALLIERIHHVLRKASVGEGELLEERHTI